MATNAAPLNVEMTDELRKAIGGALNPEDIKALIVAEAQRQFSVADDAKTTQAAAPQE